MYIFTVYVYGKRVDSKPLTTDELMRTMAIYLANEVDYFEVKEVDAQ